MSEMESWVYCSFEISGIEMDLWEDAHSEVRATPELISKLMAKKEGRGSQIFSCK